MSALERQRQGDRGIYAAAAAAAQRETFGRQSHVPPCLTHWVSAEECSNVATKLHCFRDAGNHHHGWAQHKSALFQICRKLPWLVWAEMYCLTTGRQKCLKDFDQLKQLRQGQHSHWCLFCQYLFGIYSAKVISTEKWCLE